MSKINVIKIDINKIIEELNRAFIRSKKVNYIIMNNYTYIKIFKDNNWDNNWEEKWNNKGTSYIEIFNTPIAICDKLEDGEVDLI